MSESRYGVLIGRIRGIEPDIAGEKTPHYMLVVETCDNESYDVAINCQSTDDNNPRVLYYADENCKNEVTNILKTMDFKFHEINYSKNINPDIAIDYIRNMSLNKDQMRALPYVIKGDNDLKGFLNKNLKKAVDNENINVYVFGTYYNSYGQGVHNIHMNQGNRDKHYDENSIYHDGCFFIYLTEEDRWIACFLAFENQSWHTDERGNPKD